MSDRTNTNGENNNVSWDSHLVAVLTYDRNSSASGVNRTNGQTDEMVDGKAHGTVTYADGSVYTGMLEEGNKPGDFGMVTYVGGSAYTGELKDGTPYGFGTMTYHDKSVYVGQWKAGERCGSGKSAAVMMTSDGKHTVSIDKLEWSTNNFSPGRPATADNEDRVAERHPFTPNNLFGSATKAQANESLATKAQLDEISPENAKSTNSSTKSMNSLLNAVSMEHEERIEKTKLIENTLDQHGAFIHENRGDICLLNKSLAEQEANVRELRKKVDEGVEEREELKNAVNELKSTIDVLTSSQKEEHKTQVAFACANEYFPIPARDSAKKPPADAKKPAVAKKQDENSPPVNRTSTSTPFRRSGRKSACRSEV